MIKIVSHIFLSLMLLISTTGLAISKHYCGGKLISTTLFVEADDCCDTGDVDGCCENKTELYQLDEDYSVSLVLEIPQSVQIDLMDFALVVFDLSSDGNTVEEYFSINESPPPPKIQTALSLRQTYLL